MAETAESARPAGRGPLAEVIATRGGQAAPEAPFVIEHREALIYMLCEAAELEHGIMCQYLFAAFSLKQREEEGLSAGDVAAVTRWRQVISHVATEEMLHLALVQNLLSAVGMAPHFARPNLPAPAHHYPAGVNLTLVPFGEDALRHFMFLERPEGMALKGAKGIDAPIHDAVPLLAERDIVPQPQDFATVGHLYRSIEVGFSHLCEKIGERNLFVGPSRAQATSQNFQWPELVVVTDLASAQRAIDTILEQGEGARGHWEQAHFGQFVQILDEYREMRKANPNFAPSRPVMFATVRPCQGDESVPQISDRVSSRCADLFNVSYEILLLTLDRFFAHTEETDAQLGTLADATVSLMVGVLKPLGSLITTLPVGAEHPGFNAGPSFELFYESDYLLPHREAAWTLLEERLRVAASFCAQIEEIAPAPVTKELERVRGTLAGVADSIAARFAEWGATSRFASSGEPASAGQDGLATMGVQAAALASAVASAGDAAGELAALFGEVRVAFDSATQEASDAGTADARGRRDRTSPRGPGSGLRGDWRAVGGRDRRFTRRRRGSGGAERDSEARRFHAAREEGVGLGPVGDEASREIRWDTSCGAARGHSRPSGSRAPALACGRAERARVAARAAAQAPGPVRGGDSLRSRRPLPRDQRRARAQLAGRRDTDPSGDGSVSMRRVGAQAAVRRCLRAGGLHRREGSEAGGRPA